MPDTETASATASAPLLQGITPPKPLDVSGNVADNWKQFKQVWKNYSIITNLSTQSEEYRVALFLHCIGPEALKIYNGMQFANDEERGSLATILEKFDEFTIGEVNETYERYIFNGRNQGPDESIDAYVAALRSLAKTCGFCECLNDSLLRDRIVLGVNNLNLRKPLLQERNSKNASIYVEVVKLLHCISKTYLVQPHMMCINWAKNLAADQRGNTNMTRMPRTTRPRNRLKLTIVNSVVEVIQWSENYVLHGKNAAKSVTAETISQPFAAEENHATMYAVSTNTKMMTATRAVITNSYSLVLL